MENGVVIGRKILGSDVVGSWWKRVLREKKGGLWRCCKRLSQKVIAWQGEILWGNQVPFTAEYHLWWQTSMAHGLAVVKLVAGRVFGIQGLVYERELFLHSLEQRDNRFLNNMVCGELRALGQSWDLGGVLVSGRTGFLWLYCCNLPSVVRGYKVLCFSTFWWCRFPESFWMMVWKVVAWVVVMVFPMGCFCRCLKKRRI